MRKLHKIIFLWGGIFPSGIFPRTHFYKGVKRSFLNLKRSQAGNVVSIVKKEYGSFVNSL